MYSSNCDLTPGIVTQLLSYDVLDGPAHVDTRIFHVMPRVNWFLKHLNQYNFMPSVEISGNSLESVSGTVYSISENYEVLCILNQIIIQALSRWLLIIGRQPFSSLAIDFKDLQANLSQNCNRNIQCRLG